MVTSGCPPLPNLPPTSTAVFCVDCKTGTLVWETNAKDKAEPVRVENAFPAIVSRDQFTRVADLLRSRAPSRVHPRRVASSYLLSGLVKCAKCGKALAGHEAKRGKFAYYVCQSLAERGRGACNAPRLNAKRFERLIVDQSTQKEEAETACLLVVTKRRRGGNFSKGGSVFLVGRTGQWLCSKLVLSLSSGPALGSDRLGRDC